MPKTGAVTPQSKSGLAVRAQGSDILARFDDSHAKTFVLPEFTKHENETFYIDIFNCGTEPFDFTVNTSADWLKAEPTGTCASHARIYISVDWEKFNSNFAEAEVKISGADAVIGVHVSARDGLPQNLPAKTYIGTREYVSINPANFTKNVAAGGAQFTEISGYGRDTDSMKILPNSAFFAPNADAPMLEYNFYIETDEECTISVFQTPTNPPRNFMHVPKEEQTRFSVQINDGERITVCGLPDGEFTPGHGKNWNFGVMNNTRITQIPCGKLSKDVHTLRIFAVDPAVIIQKIVIAPKVHVPKKISRAPQTEHFMDSFFGPPESCQV
jgi:hypothetical protein